MDVEGNDTVVELMHLQPATAYGITVFGRSEEFDGQRSEEVFVYTLQPIGKLDHVIGMRLLRMVAIGHDRYVFLSRL